MEGSKRTTGNRQKHSTNPPKKRLIAYKKKDTIPPGGVAETAIDEVRSFSRLHKAHGADCMRLYIIKFTHALFKKLNAWSYELEQNTWCKLYRVLYYYLK